MALNVLINSKLSELLSIPSDTSTMESWKPSGSSLISGTSSLDVDLVMILSDSFVTATKIYNSYYLLWYN